MSTCWADIDEDEIMESLLQDSKEKTKIEQVQISKWSDEIIKNYFNPVEEYCQIGLVLFMMSQQKTINIYRDGKEDREYDAAVLMRNVQVYFTEHIPTYEWTKVLHDLCLRYKETIRGNLIHKTLRAHVDTSKILSNQLLDKNIARNKKIYIEKKGYAPIR